MLFAGGQALLQTYKLTNLQTYTQIFSQHSGISSHSFGRSYSNNNNKDNNEDKNDNDNYNQNMTLPEWDIKQERY